MTRAGHDLRDLARLFSLGANDARTPLATLTGYTKTLARELADTDSSTREYVSTIDESLSQIGSIVERLALVSRIEEGRYTPALTSVRVAELTSGIVGALGAERVEVRGEGAVAKVDGAPTQDALTACARAAMRHGATDFVTIDVVDTTLSFHPIKENARPVLDGSELREFGAAAALIVLETLGSTTELVEDRFVVRLPE